MSAYHQARKSKPAKKSKPSGQSRQVMEPNTDKVSNRKAEVSEITGTGQAAFHTAYKEGGENMNNKGTQKTVDRKKVIAITALMVTAIAIAVTGAAFSVFSFVYGINLTVLNSQIHGAIFGLVISFLGIRYLLSVMKLKSEVYKTAAKFSWANFKKVKAQKACRN